MLLNFNRDNKANNGNNNQGKGNQNNGKGAPRMRKPRTIEELVLSQNYPEIWAEYGRMSDGENDNGNGQS